MSGVSISITACLIGFLFGSLPFGLWWGRLFGGIDVREHGSRNLGATNVFRLLGPSHGIAVLLLDILKGAAAVLVARRLGGTEVVSILGGLFAVLGHLFSPWVAFRGGKGVATGLGAWLMIAPAPTGLALLAFAGTVASTRRVSVGSLAASLVLVAAVYFLTAGESLTVRTAAALATAGLVWIRHRGNLVRLARGGEPPLWGGHHE